MSPEAKYLSPPVGISYSCIRIHPEEPLLYLGTSNGKVIVFHLDYMEVLQEIQFKEENPFGDEFLVHEVVSELSFVKNNNQLLVFLDKFVYILDANTLEKLAQFPAGGILVAGTYAEELDRLAILNKNGELSSWKYSIQLNLCTYPIKEGFPGIKIQYISEDQLLVIYPEGEIWLIDLKDRYHQILSGYSEVTNLLQIYFSDKNHRYEVFLTPLGTVEIHEATSGTQTDFQRRNMSGQFSGMITQTAQNYNEKSILSEVVSLVQKSEVIKTENRVKITERISKDRYYAIANELSASSDLLTVKQEVEQSNPDLSLAQAVETYLEYKNGKTRSILLKLCALTGTEPKSTIVAYKLNNRRSKGLIEYAKKIQSLASKRTVTYWYILVLVYILLFLGFVLYTFFSGPFLYVSTGILSSVILFLLFKWFRLNKSPRISFIDELHLFKRFALLSTFLLLGLVAFEYYRTTVGV